MGEKKRNLKWVFEDLSGAIVFPPMVLKDRTIIVQTIGGLNIDISGLAEINSRLFAISQEGKHIWNIELDNELIISPAVVSSNGKILITTVKFTKDNVISSIKAIEPANGNVKWTINSSDFDTEDNSFSLLIPPAVDESGSIFVAAIGSNKKIKSTLAEVFKQEAENVSELVKDTINEMVEIFKGESLKNSNDILDDFEEKTESVLSESANELFKDLDFNDPDNAESVTCICALDANSGKIKWQNILTGDSYFTPVATNNGSLIVEKTDYFKDIRVNLRRGLINVNFDSGNPESTTEMTFISDLSIDDSDFMKTFGSLSALDVSDGSLLWTKELEEVIFFSPVLSPDSQQAIVSAIDVKEINIDLESKVFSINVKDGSVVWESSPFDGLTSLVSLDLLNNSPLLTGSDGSVFFPLFDFEILFEIGDGLSSVAKMHALTPGGASKWQKPFTHNGTLLTNPVISNKDDSIFLSISRTDKIIGKSNLSKNDRDDRKKRRERRKSRKDALRLNFESNLVWLNPINGEVFKSFEMNGFGFSSPAIDDTQNRVFAVTTDLSMRKKSLEIFSLIHAFKLN